ncbi:hypothetical protein GCM10028784_36620 [Myceligenerans cantabricum]
MSRSGFVPPYLLHRVAEAAASGLLPAPAIQDTCRHTLDLDAEFRGGRSEHQVRTQAAEPEPAGPAAELTWTVHTAGGSETLPGEPVRDETDDAPSGDDAVDEAWDGVSATLALFADTYGRTSYDDDGARVSATVHYGQDYQNAFWDGTQLVFGDGDGRVFHRFTIAVDILAHELGHAVTEHTAGLVYRDQPGALNESMSDVFGSCVKQRVLGQEAQDGDWLIGEGLFTQSVRGRALRSMSEPGSAYDDPVLGKDPQPGHLADYVDTTDDNGGVHINSGIPNRAFYLAATEIGGPSAEGAGKIWYDALLAVGPDTDFAGFAAATVEAAGEHVDAVRGAWEGVGVVAAGDDGAGAPEGDGAQEPPSGTGAPCGVVEVRRSGGVAGMTETGAVDLDGDDPLTDEVRTLVHRVDIMLLEREAAGRTGRPGRTDGFTYVILCGGHEVAVPEERATPDLLRLVRLVLSQGR